MNMNHSGHLFFRKGEKEKKKQQHFDVILLRTLFLFANIAGIRRGNLLKPTPVYDQKPIKDKTEIIWMLWGYAQSNATASTTFIY